MYRAATTSFDYQNPALALEVDFCADLRADESRPGRPVRAGRGRRGLQPALRPRCCRHRTRSAVALPATIPSSRTPSTNVGRPRPRRAGRRWACRWRRGRSPARPASPAARRSGCFSSAATISHRIPAELLETLEVLASRAAEVLAFARQTATQGYLFHKLELLYQAAHAISGTHDRQEAIRQTAVHLLKATTADTCEVLILDEGEGLTTRFRQQLGKSPQQSLVTLVTDRMPDYPIHRQVLSDLHPAKVSLAPPEGSARDLALMQSRGHPRRRRLPARRRRPNRWGSCACCTRSRADRSMSRRWSWLRPSSTWAPSACRMPSISRRPNLGHRSSRC